MCVGNPDRMQQNYNRKVQLYQTPKNHQGISYVEMTGHHFVPFIMDHNGRLHDKTLAAIQEWSQMAPATTFVRDLIVKTQVGMLRGMMVGINSLKYRNQTLAASAPS